MESAMSALLTELGLVVTWVFGTGIPAAVELIVGQPLLLMTTGILLAGACFGLLQRALSKG